MKGRMRAVRLHGVEDLRIDEVEIPVIGPREVLVRIHVCGVCPSDVRPYRGVSRGKLVFPRRLGHEWVGEIVDKGQEVEGLAVGDRVAACWRVVCGVCAYCRRGDSNYCTALNLTRIVGGFAEYGRIAATNVYRIPEGVSYEEASFAEPLACCLNGQDRSGVKSGDDVVVLGAGPIGLLHVQLSRLRGARVVAVDFRQERLALARAVGAQETVCLDSEDLRERVSELTGGKGADRVIVATGAVAAVADAMDIAAACGNVNLFAGIYPAHTVELDPNFVHYKQVELTGSHDFTAAHFQLGLKLLSDGGSDVRPLISHRLPLEDIEEGFRIVAEQRGAKVLILPG